MAGLKKVQDDFAATMQKMLDRASSPQGAFARVYSVYQKLQTERFMSENSSEGDPWPALTFPYVEYKKRRFGGGPKRKGGNWLSWPGNGQKMLVATSTLAGAVIGPGAPFEGTDKHRALFTTSGMSIEIDTSGTNAEGRPFNYAEYVAETRPFMDFSDESLQAMTDAFSQFILGDDS